MIKIVEKDILYNNFEVTDFSSLNKVIDNMSPSMVEYYLFDLYNYADTCNAGDIISFNKKNIEDSIHVDDYSIYIDYNEDIFLEKKRKENHCETDSFSDLC